MATPKRTPALADRLADTVAALTSAARRIILVFIIS
jgi:hypothetical protein